MLCYPCLTGPSIVPIVLAAHVDVMMRWSRAYAGMETYLPGFWDWGPKRVSAAKVAFWHLAPKSMSAIGATSDVSRTSADPRD
jgi:hypothetical protein